MPRGAEGRHPSAGLAADKATGMAWQDMRCRKGVYLRHFYIDFSPGLDYLKVRISFYCKTGEKAMPTATLTSKGQMVIPKIIRDRLGLHPGDTLDFVVQDSGDVLIRPATDDVRRLKGLLHRPGRAPVSLEDMEKAIRRRRRQER